MPTPRIACFAVTLALFAAVSCVPPRADGRNGNEPSDNPVSVEDIKLPAGFTATTFADSLGEARHLIVRENGDVYVSLLRKSDRGGGIVALRDRDGDGKADDTRYFGDVAGTGLDIHAGYLYFGENTRVVRFKFDSDDELAPAGDMEIVIDGFPPQGAHAAKPITFDNAGHLYVNLGVPSNACQENIRTPGQPGQDPCPELANRGIFRYDALQTGQQHPDDGMQFATGLRQCVAVEWNATANHLYVVQHGRDQLDSLWPGFYNAEDNAELPAEEMHLVTEGLNAGWPYTYWDGRRDARMVAPEYGGNGRQKADQDKYAAPIVAFPAHWAPNDLIFYNAARWPDGFADDARPFPQRYRNGAFIAFHGSWNRAPLPQQGYKVVFQPFNGAEVAGDYEDFATGFAGLETIPSPRQARHRPCGLAVAPDGALFVVDSLRGRVWRITYEGD